MPNKRILSEAETKKLQEFNLSSKAEKTVREAWELAQEVKDHGSYFPVFGFVIILLIVNLFVAGGSIPNFIALAIVGLLFICFPIIMCIAYSMAITSRDKGLILCWTYMNIWNNSKIPWKIYGKINFILMLLTLIYFEYFLMAVICFLLLIIAEFLRSVVVVKVQRELNEIEKS